MLAVRSYILVLAFALLLSSAAYCAAAQRMPEGSFLTRPVTSVQGLVDLIERDEVVAARYTKHFGMSKAALVDYFVNNLEAITVEKPTSYTVYFVTPSGRLVSHYKTLYPGDQLFITHDGTPVMDVKCGNPLSKRLPVIQAKKPQPAPVVAVEPSLTETPAIQPDVVSVEPTVTAVLWEPPFEYIAPPIAPSILAAAGIAIPAILGVGALAGSQTVVPEPGSLMMLGLGMTGLLSMVCRRRSRK